ncbi:E3 ubiquitin-protein ligase RNF31-like [Anneissia japonica]|uniref:E3 ubiquitin-protein ligase RNF31-like n=1 Tax=Anneissia japonica TaxID=1529436 RepID=UPI001425BAA8|nr:E3 ubiquitin-protein ligase RNF31-like [Anneissia japonica]
MADPHEYITGGEYYSSFQGDIYGPYESSSMLANIRNTRIQIMNNIRGKQTINPTVLVENMLKTKCPVEMHYEVIDIVSLLRKNIVGKRESEALQTIKTALGVLEKYGRNLLKPVTSRPPKWKIIFFSNGVFKTKVGVVEGSKEILQKFGYSMPISDGLSFPDEVNHPDEEQVVKILTDLIVAKVEIERYMNKLHPHPEALYHTLHNSPITSIVSSDMYGPASGLARQVGSHTEYGPSSQTAPAQPSLSTLGSTIYGTEAARVPSPIQSQPQAQVADRSEDHKPQAAILSRENSDTDCNLCGDSKATVYCNDCENSNCEECDKVWHSHPKRKGHKTELLTRKVDVDVKTDPDKPNLQMAEEFKKQPEPSVPDNFSQQIAAKLKRPPSTHLYENVSDGRQLSTAFHDGQRYLPGDGNIVQPLMYSHETKIKRPVPAPRTISESSGDEPSIPSSGGSGSTYKEIKSQDSVYHGSPGPLSQPASTSTPVKPQDIEEIKKKIWRKCITILEQVQVIQEKQDAILDENCDQYIVLEKEREVLMNRHKSLMKRMEALDVVLETGKSKSSKHRLKLETPQQPTEPRNTPEVTKSEPFEPLVLNIKKPPVEDILNITPGKPPASEKADPKRLDDKEVAAEGHQASNQAKNPPMFYTPPNVPVPLPRLSANPTVRPDISVKLKSSVDVPEELQQIQDSKHTIPQTSAERQQNEHSVAPAGGFSKNDMPEVRSEKPVFMSSERVQAAGWECQYCTFWNTDTGSFICEMCSKTTYRNMAASVKPKSSLQGAAATIALTPLARKEAASSTLSPGIAFTMQKEEEEMLESKRRARLEDEAKYGNKSVKEPLSQTFPRISEVSKRKPDEFLHSLGPQMTLTDMRIRTKQEDIRGKGQALVTAIREAQCKGFDFEMIEVALNVAEKDNIPIDIWLDKNYHNFVESVKVSVTDKLNAMVPGATISDEQIRDVIYKHKGDREKIEQECIEKIQNKIVKLTGLKLERGGHVLTTEEIIAELTNSKGDVNQMLAEVFKDDMKQFYDRIWEKAPYMKESFFDFPVEEREKKVRILFAEHNLKSWGRSENALQLISEMEDRIKEDPEYFYDVVQAANSYWDIQEAKNFLNKDCSVCFMDFPMSRLLQSPFCQQGHQCLICKECFKGHFTVCIKDRNILDASCPSCDLPKLMQITEAEVSQYFAMIDVMLRSVLDKDVYDLLHRKLRDLQLFKDDRFRWCLHCGSGFINEQNIRKMQCPDCKKYSCFECKKKWEPQHDNISCEEFEQWRRDNDPDLQAAGLARHLQENGIDCPKCKMRYDLAKGGCMHFRCTQCKHEFCCGCKQPMSSKCTRYESCRTKGLHTHHPRDCLFYLRDLDVDVLQNLLKSHDVAFDTEPKPGERVDKCPVQEQKDTPNGLTDEKCGKAVKGKNAGLCEVHYKEYLVGLINTKHIDPAETFDAHRLKICITRHEMRVPDRRPQESEENYKQRLLKVVQDEFPIV